MFRDRIESLIELMKTVPAEGFNLEHWAHSCETPSCVAGWACQLPSWQEKGGLFVSENTWATPKYDGYVGEEAFAKWAGLSNYDADVVCGTISDEFAIHKFYETEVLREAYDLEDDEEYEAVTPKHVVAALTRMLEANKRGDSDDIKQ